jgi:hypothetical protein
VDDVGLLEVMMRFGAIVIAVSAAACAGMMPLNQAATLVPGLYSFYENPSGLPNAIEGTMRIMADSVDVDANPPCVSVRRARPNDPFVFNCVTYSISADHSTGQWRVAYFATKSVSTVTEKCVYTRLPNGKEVCSSKTQEREEHQVPVRGLLRLTSVDSTERRTRE